MIEALESPCELGSGGHGVDDDVCGIAVADTDLDQRPRRAGADQHDEIIELEHADRMEVGVKHVAVCRPVAACAGKDLRLHDINIS